MFGSGHQKRKNEDDYYEYFLLYVDDYLVISDCAKSLLKDNIGQQFVLKKSSIGPLSQYLGGKLRQVNCRMVQSHGLGDRPNTSKML